MRQYGTPGGVSLPDDRGLYFVLEDAVRRDAERCVLSRKNVDTWQDISYREFTDDVRVVAEKLLDTGVEHGDRVAVLGRTSYEWAVIDYAVLSIGAVTVPIYPTASETQINHTVKDSGATWCFVETAEQRTLLREVGGGIWAGDVWLFDDVAGWTAEPARQESEAFRRRSDAVRADDLATIVYTSGTTGMPKGCMLTHRNMFASSANVVEHTGVVHRDPDGEQPSTLLCLPLSHVFGRTMLLTYLYGGTRTGLLSGIPDLMPELRVFRPTTLSLVPYALEKIRKAARQPAAGGQGVIDGEAERVAIAYGTALAHGEEITAELRDAHAAFEETAYRRFRESLGGRFRYVISGGASLDETTAAFYTGVGITVLGAYGLTEAATAVTVNEPATNRLGSVGRPIPGVTVAIADDDEVLVQGANVSPGYWPAAEASGARGGWLAGERPWLQTGDLGRLDDEGFLYITGRRKEILVTNGGKNVSPTPLEDRVRLHPLVSNCMVVGDGRSFVTALITVIPSAVAEWQARNGIALPEDGWTEDPRLLEELQRAIDDANGLVSRAESIRRFSVLPVDFTLDQGHLTPSLKLRRAVIEHDFRHVIAALYG